MKIKIFFSLFAGVLILVLASATIEILSPCDSPLVGDHSGAPGETNCTYCHAGTPNTGSGLLEFHVGDDSTYVPGQTYTCTVKMAQAGLDKFGFVDLALKNSNNTTIGTFNLINTLQTRKYTLGGRNYISHTPCGADVDTLGQKYWYYTWTAPSTNVGNITLYISGLAANHDEATTGDFTYTKTVTLIPSVTSVNELEMGLTEIRLFPNPASEYLELSYCNSKENAVEISLFNLQGQLIKTFFDGKQSPGKQFLKFNLKGENISPGTYFLKIRTSKGNVAKPLIIH